MTTATKPSIGVTGVVTMDDVRAIAECVRMLPPTHRLMAGVLVSAKTLNGEPTENRRYPKFGAVEELLRALDAVGAWPVVHFNTRAQLQEQLERLGATLLSMKGLQLNVSRPDPAVVEGFLMQRPDVEFILQVNRSVVPVGATITPRDVFEYIRPYAGLAKHALLDLSGGEGREMSAGLAADVLNDWPWPGIVPSFAGGLGPDAGPLLAELASKVRDPRRLLGCSFDAESRLRVAIDDPIPQASHQDRLNAEKATRWVSEACRVLHTTRTAEFA